MNFSISKKQTNITKGIAISFIVFHNFFHGLPGALGENEMFFKPLIFEYTRLFYDSPTSFLRSFFSYFGHYGVQLFIFISGYGLAKSYSKTTLNTPRFVAQKFLAIYKLMAITIASLLFLRLIGVITPGIKNLFKAMLGHALMINNLSLETMFDYIGPWWFFDLILQLYLIFPLLYFIVRKYNEKGFVILLFGIYGVILITLPLANKVSFPIFGNFIGHLPEFTLGVYLALYPNKRISINYIPVALFLFILGTMHSFFFPFTFIAITYLSLVLILNLYNNDKNSFWRFIGKISPYIFVMNGPLRDVFLNSAEYSSDIMQVFYSVIHFILVIFISTVIYFFFNYLRLPTKAKLCQYIIKR